MDVVQKYELSLRATRIFEKEILIFCYFAIFTFLSSSTLLNPQLLLFLVGTILQIVLKLKSKLPLWNNFVGLGFFIIGSVVNLSGNFFSRGFLAYIFLISAFSFVYEKWRQRVSGAFVGFMFDLAYSAAVISSFPTLYALFLRNKLDINIFEFIVRDQELVIVFSGYFVFYIMLLINKQLVAVQNHLLKARTGAGAIPGELG